jgi:hypothetical protein
MSATETRRTTTAVPATARTQLSRQEAPHGTATA